MTPKEKAKELFYKFYGNKSADLLETYLKADLAKMSALIAVNELLKDTDASSPFEEQRLKFWQEVKQEIEKL